MGKIGTWSWSACFSKEGQNFGTFVGDSGDRLYISAKEASSVAKTYIERASKNFPRGTEFAIFLFDGGPKELVEAYTKIRPPPWEGSVEGFDEEERFRIGKWLGEQRDE